MSRRNSSIIQEEVSVSQNAFSVIKKNIYRVLVKVAPTSPTYQCQIRKAGHTHNGASNNFGTTNLYAINKLLILLENKNILYNFNIVVPINILDMTVQITSSRKFENSFRQLGTVVSTYSEVQQTKMSSILSSLSRIDLE